jgi:RNA-directed DNA polymerase
VSYTLKPFREFVKLENLYISWRKFRSGKGERSDVMAFERRLEKELIGLSEDLSSGIYAHGDYQRFFVRDPKFRVIHKACVRDRVVHQALYDVLYPLFDRKFFFDSYSSRCGKGTQAAIRRLWQFLGKASKNFTREAYIFHGDVDNFFGSVDHNILFRFLSKEIRDKSYLNLCKQIIVSHNGKFVKGTTGNNSEIGTGLPLGNLTSQVFANVYLHELDYFVKQTLKIPYYVRYNDDFFIVSENKDFLKKTSGTIQEFLHLQLKLAVPDNKIIIKSLSDGIDILGAVAFPYGLVPRRRLYRAAIATANETMEKGYNTPRGKRLNSYIGLLSQSKSFLLRERLRLSLILNNQPV